MEASGVAYDGISYSTREALSVLYEEIGQELEKLKAEVGASNWKRQFSFLHDKNVESLFHWTSGVLMLFLAVCLLVSYCFGRGYNVEHGWLVVECLLLLLFVVVNVYWGMWNNCMKNQDFFRLATQTLQKLENCLRCNSWNASNFPHVHSPLSPCVSLQWTIRDQELVNVPHALLVKGDIILMRPGQQVPARCQELEESDEIHDLILNQGDIYNPGTQHEIEHFAVPQQKQPLEPQKFVLLETPYLKNLRCMLEDSFKRPDSIIDHQKYAVLIVWLERRIIPTVFILMLITNTIRYVYLKDQIGHWTEMFLTLQVQSVFPLLPLVFPLIWQLLDIYGQSRVVTVFHVTKKSKIVPEGSFSSDSSLSVDEAREELDWREIWHRYLEIFRGNSPSVCRKINLVHILGSVTSLCCVDKKGILSWPNPSAEKIFVLAAGQKDSLPQTVTTDGSQQGTPQETPKSNSMDSKKKNERGKFQNAVFGTKSKVEVLDLTHDAKSAFGLHFDDPTWKKHINSLKPLGLNILTNTCHLHTISWYTQFTDHVASAALENEETVAVVNRRCLCELAKQIGFSDQALDIFSLNKILGLYRQVPVEAANRDRVQRSRPFGNHRIPMPNMVSVVVQEKNSGICQLMSQGTADVLLDCCSDFWSGDDLCVLTESHRKKILDFYHRTSMASYCTAFSYRPLTQHFSPQLNKMYIELPVNCSDILFPEVVNPQSDIDTDMSTDCQPAFSVSRAFSVDSLFETTSIASIEDVSGCFHAQTNQIFIGMVTMQYQARQEFVQLIEKLEGACIRFVHFSQENEVRSRVFSEKMGLEAGWNCHISLRSKKSKKSSSRPDSVIQGDLSHHASHHSSHHSTNTVGRENNVFLSKQKHSITSQQRSYSAPSVVNLDASQVKFEVKVMKANHGRGSSFTNIEADMDVEKDCLIISDKAECNSDIIPRLMDHEAELQNECDLPIDWLEDSGEDIVDMESHHTSSYVTENTDSFRDVLDDNRAQLPQGIENIRPHLENVDNVPLLVNLFTDCTADTSQEMMKIMQEYGEVVLCLGSSVNIYNTQLFLQADCSLAIEPMYPQVCAKQPVMLDPWDEDQPSPMQIASTLLTIICPLSFKKEDHVGLIKLIAEARNHLMSVSGCFYLMVCYVLSISLIQVLASLFLLPPVLASQHLLWLVLVVIPLLSLTMMGNPVDPSMMSLASRKNKNHLTKQMVVQFILYFSLRFVPSIAITLLCHGLTLYSFCQVVISSSNSTRCALYDFNTTVEVPRLWYDRYAGGLVLSQNISHFLLVLYFIVISLSYVHWFDHVWQKPPFRKKLWSLTVVMVLCCQIFHFACDVLVRNSYLDEAFPLSEVHVAVWVLGLVWPFVLVFTNELLKRKELKLSVRYQKRARLSFGTKLGMNSPFG